MAFIPPPLDSYEGDAPLGGDTAGSMSDFMPPPLDSYEGDAPIPAGGDFIPLPPDGGRLPAAAAVERPVTFYSLSKRVGGTDETHDRWTDRGFSSKGQNLTPGVAAVNDKVYPLGTVLRDAESGQVFLATDRHGNADPNVVDIYVPPDAYQQAKVVRRFEVAGRVDKVPTTPEGVRAVLAEFGTVPEGESAVESLARLSSDGAEVTTLAKSDFTPPPLDSYEGDAPLPESAPEPEVRFGIPVNPSEAVIDAMGDQAIPAAEPVSKRAVAADGALPIAAAAPGKDEFGGVAVDDGRPSGAWDAIERAVRRGWMAAETAIDIQNGNADAGVIAGRQREIARLKPTEDYEVTWNDRVDAGESFNAFLKNPLLNVAQLTAESMGAMLRSQWNYIGKVPERATQGMVGAGAAGMAVGPEGAAAMAPLGLTVGASAGLAESSMLASYATEYAGSMLGALQDAGVNVENEAALRNALLDDATMAEVRASADRKAVPVALVDGLMAAIGGRLFASPAKRLAGKVMEWGGELAVQAVGGMAGEAAGQLNQQGKISSARSVVAEGVGEIGGSVGEVAVGRVMRPIRGAAKTEARTFRDFSEMPAMPDPEPAKVIVSTDWLGGTKDAVEAREAARKWWENNHAEPVEVEHEEFSVPIIIGTQGVKHGTKGSSSFDESASVPFLPELIKKSRRVSVEPDKKGRNTIKAVHHLQVPVVFDGADRTMNIVVRETTSGTLFYDHSYVKSESAGISGEQPVNADSAQPAADSGSNVARGNLDVNPPVLKVGQVAETPNGPSAVEGISYVPGIKMYRVKYENGTVGIANEESIDPAHRYHPDAAYMPKPPGWKPAVVTGDEAFLPDSATMPRKIEWLKPETKGNPSLRDIRKWLRKALDVPIRGGMRVSRGAQSALGAYRIGPETIRLRALNDVPTLMHEVGHYLHHMVFPVNGDRGRAENFGGVYDGELLPMGAVTSAPTYSRDMVRMEGVAEWFRTWVADPAAARVLAPQFTDFFESTVEQEHVEMARILETLQQKVRQYVAQPTKAKAMGMVLSSSEVDQAGGTFSDWFKRQYTAWFHELAPLERAMDLLMAFGLPKERARVVVNLANNYKGGWKSKADYDLEHAQTDLYGVEVGVSLRKIMAMIPKGERKEFSTYAALKRAEEKKRQGVTTGFEDVMRAADYPAMMSEWSVRFEAARRLLVKYTENQVDMLRQAGLVSDADVVAMRAANAEYVPFHRAVESLTGAGKRSGGKGYVNTTSGIRGMKGSDLEIIDPIESVVKNTMLFRELAERNRAGLAFVEAVRETQGGGRIGEMLLQPLKATRVQHEEVVAQLRAAGVLQPGQQMSKAAADLGFTVFRMAKGANSARGTFEVMKDGKPMTFQVDDKELLRAMTMMDSVDAETFSRFPLLNVLKGATALLRKGATLTPEFIVRNPFRDQIIAGVYSKHGFVPFWDGFRGVLSAVRKDDAYREWLKAGGKYGGLYDVEVHDSESLLAAVARRDPSAVGQAAYLLNPLNVLKHLAYAGELLESGTRVSEFRRARAAGLTPEEAAMASKDVTLNFSRNGYRGAVANKMVAFFNAALQDMDKMVRTFRERPAEAAMKAFLYITVPSILCWWLGKDDEEIKRLPEWRKSFFWNVNLRHFTGEGFILTIPKPFLLGALFGTSVEKGLDLAAGKDPNAVGKFFSAVLQNTLIRGDVGIATAMKPLIENMTNYSFFKDGPLQNQGQMAMSPGMRSNSNTSLIAREIGKRFDVSPILIDNAVRGYLGGLGRYGTDAIDWALMAAHVVDIPPRPTPDPREAPLLRALLVPQEAGSEDVSRFYRAMDRAENRMRDFKALGDRMDSPGKMEFKRKNFNELAYYGGGDAPKITELRRVRAMLTDITKAQQYVLNTRTMSPDVKRDKLRQLSARRDEIARRAFSYFHPTDKEAAY